MKKFVAILLTLMLVLGMTAAVAEPVTTDNPYTDMPTITLTKTYNLTNAGTISPAETFAFTALTCTDVADAGVGVTKENAPVPTIGDVAYAQGEAGSSTATKEITITLPEYTAVGKYTYTFSEINKGTAGVTYRPDAIKLVVTVIEQNGKVRVAAVHTEKEGAKSGNFENTGYARPGKYGLYNILIMEEKQTIVALGAGSITKRVFPDGRIERCDNVKDVGL